MLVDIKFEASALNYPKVHWTTPKCTELPQNYLENYKVNITSYIYVPNPKLQSFSLYGQLFLSYSLSETNAPNDLNNLEHYQVKAVKLL